jgi:uncharacterized membrane protein YidH (DUF202 family)
VAGWLTPSLVGRGSQESSEIGRRAASHLRRADSLSAVAAPSSSEAPAPPASDVTRRTYLAAERTWLAWWRTGLAATATALGVGRLLPELVDASVTWPYVAVGCGFGLVALALVILGWLRQRQVDAALRAGTFSPLPDSWVSGLALSATVLTLATIAIVVVQG